MSPAWSLAHGECLGNILSGSVAARKIQKAEVGVGHNQPRAPQNVKSNFVFIPLFWSPSATFLSHSVYVLPKRELSFPFRIEMHISFEPRISFSPYWRLPSKADFWSRYIDRLDADLKDAV